VVDAFHGFTITFRRPLHRILPMSARVLSLPGVFSVVCLSAVGAQGQQCGEQVLGGPEASYFGNRIATDGETLLVRRRILDWPSLASRVDHFERIGGLWVQRGTLETTAAGFGVSLAVDGALMAVGVSGMDPAVHLYARDQGVWNPSAVLTPSDPATGQQFAMALDLDGEHLAVGAPGGQESGGVSSGRVYLYERVGPAAWIQADVLWPGDGAAGDSFGGSVALAGDGLAVGASGHDSSGADAGAVYRFERVAGTWQPSQKLEGPGAGARFGAALAYDGDRMAVAAPGIGRVSVWRREGGAFLLESDLDAPEAMPYLRFGAALDLDGARLIVGAPSDLSGQPGASYLFTRVGSGWTLAGKFQQLAAGSGHGGQVALGGDALFVGWGDQSEQASRLFAHDLGAPWGAWANIPSVGLDFGGAQLLRLTTCPPLAGGLHWLVGSASGTHSGLPLTPELTLNLTPDAYFWIAVAQPSPPPIVGGVGTLGVDGAATPSIVIPPGAPPALAGLELNHAFAGFTPDGQLAGVGPPVALELRTHKRLWEIGVHAGADFAQIHEAIASPMVQAGDTLWVAPGEYQDFVLTKPLAILGHIGEPFRVHHAEVRDVESFALAHLRASFLDVRNVWGRGALDFVAVWDMVVPGVFHSGALFEDCDEIVVSNSTFFGGDTCIPGLGLMALPGLQVRRSKATLVDSSFSGGWVVYDDVLCKLASPDFFAQAAIEVLEDSEVTLAGCRLWGGYNEGVGHDGHGLLVLDSLARVLGTPDHFIEAIGSTLPIQAGLDSLVRVSAVTLKPLTLSPGVVLLAEPEPYLRVRS
jgi:hypothetical protein